MAINYLASQDPRIAKAELVRDNISRDFAIEELADAVALAPRTFARRMAGELRRFTVQLCVTDQARRLRDFLLETTRLSVEQIAQKIAICGPSRASPG